MKECRESLYLSTKTSFQVYYSATNSKLKHKTKQTTQINKNKVKQTNKNHSEDQMMNTGTILKKYYIHYTLLELHYWALNLSIVCSILFILVYSHAYVEPNSSVLSVTYVSFG